MDQVILTDKEIVHMLHGAGLRPSVHRIAVLAYVANCRTHPTAEEIYVRMTEDFPNVSRTTIYNSLHALACAGFLRVLEIDKDSVRYDMAMQTPHAHFTCRLCGKIYDMPLPERLESIVGEGFLTESAELHFKGVCPECLKTNDINQNKR